MEVLSLWYYVIMLWMILQNSCKILDCSNQKVSFVESQQTPNNSFMASSNMVPTNYSLVAS